MKWLPQSFNDLLAFMYFPFVLVWVLMLALLYKYIDNSVIALLGLGTATGVILSKFSDIYQFYFRKASTAAQDSPETTTTTITTGTTTTPPNSPVDTSDNLVSRIQAELKKMADERTNPPESKV